MKYTWKAAPWQALLYWWSYVLIVLIVNQNGRKDDGDDTDNDWAQQGSGEAWDVKSHIEPVLSDPGGQHEGRSVDYKDEEAECEDDDATG